MRSTRVMEQGRKYRRYLVILGSVAASTFLLVTVNGCGHESKGNAEESAPKDEIVAVSTTSPKTQLLRRFILQPGVLKSYEETPIYTKLAGYLQTVNVDIGDRISKGELLGELWVPEVEEAVRVRESKVAQGKADVKQAEEALKAANANIITWEAKVNEAKASVIRADANLKRWEVEYQRDMVFAGKETGFGLDKRTVAETEKTRDAAAAAVRETKAGVVSAEASWSESKAKRDRAAADVLVNKTQLAVYERELEYQKRWFEYAKITAPYDGIVTRRIVHTGHFVQPANSGTTSVAAEPLFVVMRTDIIRLVVQVPEYDAPLVKDGAEALIRLQAYRGQEFKAKVTRSSWALDKDARTLRVEIFLDNPPWFNFNDHAIAALQKANVPDSVLAKLTPLKDKEVSQEDFMKGISQALNADEMRKFKDIILKRADSPNAPMKLQAGMYGNISITADVPNALTLPSEAILTDGNKNYCFMIEDGKARRVNIKVGVTNDKITEVLKKEVPSSKSGVEGGWVSFTGSEQIITSNLKSMQDGQPVKPK